MPGPRHEAIEEFAVTATLGHDFSLTASPNLEAKEKAGSLVL